MDLVDLDVGEADGVIKSLVLVIFFGVFGYAYCTRDSPPEPEEQIDPNSLTKKDQKDYNKLVTEIQKEAEKIAKIEEKMKKFEDAMAVKSTENLKK